MVKLSECGTCISVCSLLLSDERHGRLFVRFNSELIVLELKPEVKDRVVSHTAPLVGAFYSRTYSRVSCQHDLSPVVPCSVEDNLELSLGLTKV